MNRSATPLSNDAALVDLLRGGDLQALGPLFLRYGGEVRSLLLRIEPTMRPEDADDICQEVFLTLPGTLGRYTERGRLRSWLFSIAVRKSRAWRRRRWVRTLLGQQHGIDAAGVAKRASRTEEQIDARKQIDAIMQKLPAAQREVLVLNVVEGLSTQETADVLGISVNAVSTRLHRARRAMKGPA